ncbi:MAG: hypothetical protein ACK5M7_08375 [Draconibacterium sp.]
MKKPVFILLGLFCIFQVTAQNLETVDTSVFTHPVFVSPQPPKAIKGWTLYENLALETGDVFKGPVLVGEYPGKIIKFQFKGNALGIAVIFGTDTGRIEFSVDEADWELLDLKTQNNPKDKLSYFTLESGLKNRKHTLQIRMAPAVNSESSKCILTLFYFNTLE